VTTSPGYVSETTCAASPSERTCTVTLSGMMSAGDESVMKSAARALEQTLAGDLSVMTLPECPSEMMSEGYVSETT